MEDDFTGVPVVEPVELEVDEPVEVDEPEREQEAVEPESVGEGDGAVIPEPVETAAEVHLINDVYTKLRNMLVERGVPVDQIAFIHEAKDAAARTKLFARVNAGQVRVLIGSTERMGAGVNVQARAIALHHLNPPWRPRDQKQREGRINRQGNGMPFIIIINYVTKGSVDGFVWGKIKRKQQSIDAIMAGDAMIRKIEDVSAVVLNYAQIQALASGNPLVMKRVAVETRLMTLSHLRASHLDSQSYLRRTMIYCPKELAKAERKLAMHRAAIEYRAKVTPPEFCAHLKTSINDPALVLFTKREEAGQQIHKLADQTAARALLTGHETHGIVIEAGDYQGFPLLIKVHEDEHMPREAWLCSGTLAEVQADTVSSYGVNIPGTDMGTAQALDHRIRTLEEKADEEDNNARRERSQIASAEAKLSVPWEHDSEYAKLQHDLAVIDYGLGKAGVKVDSKIKSDLKEEITAEEAVEAPHAEAAEVGADDEAYRFDFEEVLAKMRAANAAGLNAPVADLCTVDVRLPEIKMGPMELELPAARFEPEQELDPYAAMAIAALESRIVESSARLVFGMYTRNGGKKRPVKVDEGQISFGFNL
jgi:hypothetical protein